ncbi:hypothetical protein M406DRAFT_49852 [Cryphonectria parasitica EP155]|uniref:Uncharacterized protein n=1 Tax=Cryphonectria parasitica (strain ATCC 38755 / EP155) TaxID=660469 RepID=A0A9P5CK87_CRYP1|nr:uncharacterized protein M406DRAFT_49852 [Cryphonectria parasitica EP155]KAF3761793.1 hypothetical protein M406DRAFT_49852 [Cryphonectria parasitica EP155]
MDAATPPPFVVYEEASGTVVSVSTHENCPEYGRYAAQRHGPFTGGRYDLPYQRPADACRKVVIPEVEAVIVEMNKTIKDPDLFRLFENCFPNTLDTSVTWTGVSNTNVNEELTFITTGDIHAMWLRDSANQLQSYVSLLKPPQPPQHSSKDTTTTTNNRPSSSSSSSSRLASLFRGAINLQARYILASPHCNAFQPPAEAGMAPGNDGNKHDLVWPPYRHDVVFECKYELDSLAAFLQLSWDYFSRTKDTRFFGGADGWMDAVITILDTVEEMRMPTYSQDGKVPDSPYRFERTSSVPTETLANRGNGSPVKGGTGLIRSGFRPSDDATTYQFLIPANMMLVKYLEQCAEIMAKVEKEEDRLATRMRRIAKEIRKGIEKHGKIVHPDFGEILAYEVDGFASSSVMDDANLPSLLSSPLTGYITRTDPIYRATRKFILSNANPYYDHGPVINGTGGPHIGPGMVWPMSLVVGIMTTDDDEEIKDMLSQILSSTAGLGLIHESVNVHNQGMWTRSWFSWANGLFGQMILDLKERKPHILKTSFQGDKSK